MRWLLGIVVLLSIATAILLPLPWISGEFSGHRTPLIEHLVARYTATELLFLVHVVGGGLALLLAPWQLVARLRTRWPRFHRATGYLYVGAVALAGTAGLVMGPGAWAGPIAQLGFTALAVAWLATTALGLRRILAGDRAGHRGWMTYSFALAFAAVTLRLEFVLFVTIGLPHATAYQIVGWSCWVPNLIVAHVVLARQSPARVWPMARRAAP